MYFDSKDKLNKRNKYIVISALSILLLCNVVLLIVSSWYANDLAISKYFNKTMKYSVIRGISGYLIIDAYISIITFIFPLVFILIESIYGWVRNNKSHYLKPWNPFSLKLLYVIGTLIYLIATAWTMASTCFSDQGFGRGFNMWFIIGMKYLVPIFIVSLLINWTIYFSLMTYVHKVIAKRVDFLTNGFWKKALTVLLFTAILYAGMLTTKSAVGRPFLWDLEWNDYVNIIKEHYPDQYNHYINQSDIWYGWRNNLGDINNINNFPTDMQYWPWWKIGRGWNHSGNWNSFPGDANAFPSGHVDACSIIVASLLAIFSSPRNKKESNLQLTMFCLGIFYLLSMFFALEVSINHWTSDMAFSLTFVLLVYWIAYEIVKWIFNKKHANWLPNKLKNWVNAN